MDEQAKKLTTTVYILKKKEKKYSLLEKSSKGFYCDLFVFTMLNEQQE